MTRLLGLCFLALLLPLLQCSSGSADANPSGENEVLWDLVLGGSSLSLEITSEEALIQGDGGVAIRVKGFVLVEGDGEDVPLEALIDFSGGVVVDIPEEGDPPRAELSIAAEDINIIVEIGADRYLATLGTLNLERYEPEIDGKVKGSVDAGLIGILNGGDLALKGTFNFRVQAGSSLEN